MAKRSTKNNPSKLMRGCYGYQNPTCYQAMKTFEKNVDENEENIKQIAADNKKRRMSIRIDRKHKEYSIVTYDKKGHATYVGHSYEDESEIPYVNLRKDGTVVRTIQKGDCK